MRQNLGPALIATVLTALVVTPIFGMHLERAGVRTIIQTQWNYVAWACLAVFVVQMLRPTIAGSGLRLPSIALPSIPQGQRGIWIAAALILAVVGPFFAGRNAVDIATRAMIYVMLGLGLNVVVGFAGSTADAFTLLERLEKKLEAAPGQLARACVDLAKDWRMDKYLRNLEAMLIVTDGREIFVVTGAGDVLEPEHDVAAIGSGGNFALAAARGLMESDLDAEGVARKAMAIAADICVYTNGNLTVEVLG